LTFLLKRIIFVEVKKECSIWRKNRIAARLLLRPDSAFSKRDKDLIAKLVVDSEIESRLISQGIDYLKYRQYAKRVS